MEIFFLKLFFFVQLTLLSGSSFSQPIQLMSCESDSLNSLEILDDGRDYHFKMEAKKNFNSDISLPIKQYLKKGAYSFKIQKGSCLAEDGLMDCRVIGKPGQTIEIAGLKEDAKAQINETHLLQELFLKIREVDVRELRKTRDSSGKIIVSNQKTEITLLALNKKKESIGALLSFYPNECFLRF